jgi:hypothetical protein
MANIYASHAGSADYDTTAKTVATGATAEAVAGAGALVLAIIGLAGLFQHTLAAIAVIAAGAALLFQGASAGARAASLVREVHGHEAAMGTGLSAEIVGGLGGIVLGILALVGVAPMPLLAISAIVFGGALLFGSPEVYVIGEAKPDEGVATPHRYQMLKSTAAGAAGGQVLLGIGSAALGILALCGLATMTLILVAVLAVGVSALLSGGAITGKMVSMLYR